ncbi:hypothetical protein H696_00877 [Fonticula alba]|uniref:RING-type domain-containing protein n=1 Tax=Fonticula alba TaxID=691883 RepID=A0A058ZHC3_FONAL|nr:hypothetical protein H696_00877 [Fonticula alba]KCV73338.1 hypothetical protein H696_00877 [Fonticula alba]|eukprot:XP_009493039.1 hypothetical protein H696_00877 [Fonticula alba]
MSYSSDVQMVPSGQSADADRPYFEIRKWNAVALWSWDLAIENCAICRNHIMDRCINCQARQSSASGPGDTPGSGSSSTGETECSVSWGQCGHAFHYHCINKWLRARNVCPLDNREWSYTKHSR